MVLVYTKLWGGDAVPGIEMSCAPRGGLRSSAGGRPKAEPEEKHKARSFKCTDRDWEIIKQKSEKEGLNISEYVRKKALES